MQPFSDLYDFIDRSVKSRKYPPATAHSLRAALKVYESELNDEERTSIDKFEKNFDQIVRSVSGKYGKRFSASSFATYKSRVQKVLADFKQYGDPMKMNNWNPKVVIRTRKNKTSEDSSRNDLRQSSVQEEQVGFTIPVGQGSQYSFADSGTGWNLLIKSEKPLDSVTKKALVDIADLLMSLNK